MLEIIQSIDGAILLWVQDVLRLPILNDLISVFTHLGDAGFLWIALSALMLCFRKTRKVGLAALVSMLLGLMVNNVLLKELVGRPRPYETLLEAMPLLRDPDPLSFPSGHTCGAFAATGVWLRGLDKRWMGVTGLILAALMGFSRLYVGVHYPSDVLVGALVGLACSQLVWLAVRKISGWKEERLA